MLLFDHVTAPINRPGIGSVLYDIDTVTPIKYDDGLIVTQISDLAFALALYPYTNIRQTG